MSQQRPLANIPPALFKSDKKALKPIPEKVK
jgi:hypothetical protein